MQGLLLIIRRQRRPLLPMDVPPVAAINVEPANAEAVVANAATEARTAPINTTVPQAGEDAD